MDNAFRHFSSQGTDYRHYEMVVCKEQQKVRIIINDRNGDMTEYEIPFSAFVDVSMSTKDFMSPAESAAYALELLNGSSDKVTTDTGNLVKRTLAGGLLGGPVGAAIGGITASRTIEKKTHASRMGYVLSITFNDLDFPYLKYDCGEDEDSARAIFSIIKIICGRNSCDAHSEGIVVKQKSKREVQDNGRTKNVALDDDDRTKSNVEVVFYAIFQAVFMGLVLVAWNAGWWPVFIVILSVCIQFIPMLTWVCDFMGKPFSGFGNGVMISSLFMLMLLMLLPGFATCDIQFCLNDTVFYIPPYKGGIITFSITAISAMLLSVAIGCYCQKIIHTKKLWFGKYYPVPLCVSTIYVVSMFSAALLSQSEYIPISIKILICLYAIVSGLIVYNWVADVKSQKNQQTKRSQVIAGVIFQMFLYFIVIILCCHFDVLCYKMNDGFW